MNAYNTLLTIAVAPEDVEAGADAAAWLHRALRELAPLKAALANKDAADFLKTVKRAEALERLVAALALRVHCVVPMGKPADIASLVKEAEQYGLEGFYDRYQ